jgi:hypothetical protein
MSKSRANKISGGRDGARSRRQAIRTHSGLADQRGAAVKRKADAWRLFREGGDEHTRGAMYLAGYAIECKLKAIGMERFECHTLDELASKLRISIRSIYTHGLDYLIDRLRLRDKLMNSDVTTEFKSQVLNWTPDWRYDRHNPAGEDASKFLHAVDKVYAWLDVNRY